MGVIGRPYGLDGEEGEDAEEHPADQLDNGGTGRYG
jgi:hypothetical protein